MYIVWTVLIVAAFVLLLVMQKVLFRPDTSKAATLMKTYRRLTPSQLAAIPDDELVTAVVSNVLAAAEDDRTDPYYILSVISQERAAVYTVWLFLQELAHDPAALRRPTQHSLSELAADALRSMTLDALADALDRYLESGDAADVDRMNALAAEADVTAHLVAWIRSDPPAFCSALDEGD